MGKRTVLDADADAGGASSSHGVKRQRVDRSPNATAVVNSARDLQKALLFDQTAAGDFRSGLALFKSFLDSILYSSDPDDLPRRRAILREYLDTQRARSRDDRDHTLLPSLVQAWDFAAEVNFEAILAHVTAVLALLLKACAAHAELTEYGTLLARTILQPAVARRLVRSTSAAPNKDNIIAPALRLLTELTRFNQGAHAKAVYAKRDFTLEPKILARNISLRREQSAADHLKKPSVRTTAIRYLLTHLRWQDERAKTEILSNVNVVRSLFDHLSSDPPFLIEEVLDVFMSHVFQDKTIARSTKSRILSGKTLSRIASLYNYSIEADALQDGQKAPDALAHGFLRTVCTNPAFGVMLPTNGLYPAVSDDDDAELEDAAEYANELGPECIDFSRSGNLRNIILAEFIQNQRPYASTLHQELVVDIFKACPELVADYFTKRKDFSYDPKLTSTWIGYSAFLFQTIQIPVPKFFGARRNYRENPPPISALLQSIMPQPLSQQVLCKCVNHNSDLIQLFAIRVLIAALHKLQDVLAALAHANSVKPSKRWEQIRRALVKEVSRRCPPIRIVFLALKKPDVKPMKRESITRLLRLYYEVMPQVALQEKFDVSLPLCNALVEIEGSAVLPEERAFRVMELEHWVQMARHSPAMRWWQKQKTLHYSPFVTLIKLLVSSRDREMYAGIRSLLVSTLNDQEMLQTKTTPTAIEALIASLGASPGASAPSADVLDFLDDCCARFTKVPMKYIDDLDSLCARDSRSMTELGPFSPLLMTLVEQWPFRGGATETSKNADAVAQWLARILYLLKLVGEDQLLLDRVRDSLVESSASQYKEVLKDAFLWKMSKESAKDALKLATGADFSGSDRSTTSPPPPPAETSLDALPTEINIDLEEPPTEDERHIGLTRWRKKDLGEALDDGDIGSLLLCLCSAHPEIRVQAMHSIRQLMLGLIRSGEHTLKENLSGGSQIQTDPKFQQLYLLLGEVLETVEGLGSEAFPHLGGVLAARCASVVADPTNLMYSKINRFLTKAPAWNVQRLLSEFWHVVVANEPEEDGNYHNEIDWYLDYLIDSLRTPADMAYFRKSNIFEHLLNYYGSRSCAASAKEKILRLLLRATHVQGSTTLVTRCGLMAWAQMQLDKHDPRHRIIRTLMSRVYETCDRERVQDWSSGTLNEKMGCVAKVGA